MFQLIKRHRILTVFSLFLVLLIFIGWSVRPDMAPSPNGPTKAPPAIGGTAASSARQLESVPAEALAASSVECEIPKAWLQPYSTESAESLDERYERAVEFAKSVFLKSRNPDELVFAVLLSDQDGRALSRLAEEIDAGSRSPYLLWKAVNRCLSRNGSGFACPRSQWLDLQTRLDSENSEVWMRIAGLRFVQGDNAAGIVALERAANATRTEDYFARDLDIAAKGFEATGELSRYEAARLASSLSASVLPAYEYHGYACIDPGITDAYRVQLCKQYAENVKARPTSKIVATMASDIELFALRSEGQTELVDRLEAERLEETRASLRNIPSEQSRELLERMNPDLLYQLIEDFALYGEQEAFDRRVERLNEAGLADFEERCSAELAIYRKAVENGSGTP